MREGNIAGSFKSQLIDYSDLPRGYGERLRGAFGSFMIIRPSLSVIGHYLAFGMQ